MPLHLETLFSFYFGFPSVLIKKRKLEVEVLTKIKKNNVLSHDLVDSPCSSDDVEAAGLAGGASLSLAL